MSAIQRLLSFPALLPLFFLVVAGCSPDKNKNALFEVLEQDETGIRFSNQLKATPEFNMFRYMYFYNGAGVGAGDFNNDGLMDLFFSANQGGNRMFRNKGQLKFDDITDASGIPQDKSWSTGVSVVDINNDGLLDLYICRVGQFESLRGKNQLLVCQGIENGVPRYADKAAEYGIDFSGFSTQAAFFDYDRDGDLDLYLLNHSVHQNGTFGERNSFLGTYHPLTGDRFFRNDGPRFTDVTKETGINSSAIGYGLGIAVSDINNDGYPDLYIGNDFHENDYLYINRGDGTFSEELNARMMHTSQFSMGVDIADINNDALPEIISMDMLPSDPYILKRSLGEDEYNIFHMKLNYGYHPQYARNALQLNDGTGRFREIGMYAGVHATDWSWAPLWMDFNNDGRKDLFVSNGIPKRLNDIDYVSYVSNDDIQRKISANDVSEKEMAVIDNFPEIKLPNKFYLNTGNAVFDDQEATDREVRTFSNGAVYADLDNDGDLDIVVNNIQDPALVYRNTTNDAQAKPYLELQLTGPAGNRKALGARVLVFAGQETRSYEKYPVRGFQSSMEVPLHIGLAGAPADSLLLIWPDGTFQHLDTAQRGRLAVAYSKGLPAFDFTRLDRNRNRDSFVAEDRTPASGIRHLHRENPFVEFDREPLIPHMVSREGPALAVGDMNGDGLEDLFIGSSKGHKSAVWLQSAAGTFRYSTQPDLEGDSTYEDVDACWVDVNNDRHADLVVASGGNEYYGTDKHLLPRVYLGDGRGGLRRLIGAFQGLYETYSCIVPADFNGDGYTDFFLGGRAVPWEYGQVPRSHLLQNDGTGHFRDVTAALAPELQHAGFIKSAVWTDLDKDGDQDLIVAPEWDGITAYLAQNGRLVRKKITDQKGWWNFTLPVDVDGDGDMDLVAGNLGQNNRFGVSKAEAVKLYYADFDGNGKKEQVLTYFLQGREIPFANKMELEKQIPMLKKKFLYAGDFAKAALTDLFPSGKLNTAVQHSADYFSNAVLLNDGKLGFRVVELPWEAQLTSYREALAVNVNNDSLPDLFLAGNFYDNNIQMGRYDADYGTVLINKGKGAFAFLP
ncbi:MAG TPA: VCBS repeat-containing protein, partial [Chitinophagaceae bacterium]|nr:VCBS repeat-containing protein [Chitinophagaceae bacterium]